MLDFCHSDCKSPVGTPPSCISEEVPALIGKENALAGLQQERTPLELMEAVRVGLHAHDAKPKQRGRGYSAAIETDHLCSGAMCGRTANSNSQEFGLMHPTFDARSIAQLKRAAKLHQKVHGVSHSQALDAIAQEHQWPNWSLLMKHSARSGGAGVSFERSPEQIQHSLLRRSYGDVDFEDVEDLSGRFGNALNAVEFAIAYLEALLARPRFKIWSTSVAYFEARSWLPYRIHETKNPRAWLLVNRVYKPVGQSRSRLSDWAVYEDFPSLSVFIQ